MAGPPRPRPTIRDVAVEAGVSMKTVSRVLNDEPAVAVSTAERVRQAAARLGFQRNEAAAHLRRLDRSTRLLGLVTEDLKNPFYSALASAVEAVSRQHGYLLMIASSDEDADTERGVLSALCTRRVDGLIVVPTGTDHSYLLPEIESGTAVVFVDRPALAGQVDCIMAANAEGAASAVRHLLAHGHRRIGYLGDDPSIATAQERYRGYREALAAAGQPIDDSVVCLGLHDTATAEDACRHLLAATGDPVTAVFAGNNRLTIGAVHAIARHTRPVALVGFDDFELAELLHPPVTVVAQDVDAMGRAAAELLLRRLAGDRRQPERVVLGTRLIIRGSGEIPP
ncbi:MAG TPA: LacI family DNA-binding transcriptional regulator [Pseudonocardiaceae bacterium]|nr:LacI family DNA-binding transcriptional regulator [Pseudonocardiaceae bacterium]